MATGVTLVEMVKDLRAEAGHSLSVAQGQGTEQHLRYLLKRTQEELYQAYDWKFLQVKRTIPLVAASRYYNYPNDVPFEIVTEVWTHTVNSSDWRRLDLGISPADFQIYDSEAGIKAYPPQKWDNNADTNQLEVWPIPSTDTGELWVYGMKKLAPLVSNTDKCTLDSTLIVMFAAVELLSKTDKASADLKNQKAQRHLSKVLGRQSGRKRQWTSLNSSGGQRPGVIGLDYIPQGYRY
jgi:hypothetical protein